MLPKIFLPILRFELKVGLKLCLIVVEKPKCRILLKVSERICQQHQNIEFLLVYATMNYQNTGI